MHVYLSIYLVLAFAAFAARSYRRSWHLALAAGAMLALFIGGRYYVGCDFHAYLERFEWAYPKGLHWFRAFERPEGGFHLVNILSRDAGLGFNGVLMTCAVVYAAALVIFSRLAPYPLALLATAFPILVVQLGMSGMRQAMATAFLMMACVAFVRRSPWLTAMWVGIGFLFHQSAIAFLPMAIVARRQVSTKYLILGTVLLAPVAGLLLGDRMDVYTARYVDQIYGENDAGGAWIRYAAALFPFILFYWKRRIVEVAYPVLYPLLWLFMLVAFALVVVGMVSTVALHRLTFYVLPVSLLALLCVVECAFTQKSKHIAWLLPFALYGLYIVSWFTLSRHSASCYVPYQSWLL